MKTCSFPIQESQEYVVLSLILYFDCYVKIKFPWYHFITDSAKCSDLGFIYFAGHIMCWNCIIEKYSSFK